MKEKTGLEYCPTSKKVFLCKVKTDTGSLIGNKTDVTDNFLNCSAEFFEENTIREVVWDNNESSLIINIKNDKESIAMLLSKLNKQLEVVCHKEGSTWEDTLFYEEHRIYTLEELNKEKSMLDKLNKELKDDPDMLNGWNEIEL